MVLFRINTPIAQSYARSQYLDTQGFQLACALFQHGDLMRDCDVGKVRIDDFYDLIIVICKFLKLEIKVVQPRDELRLRRVASDDFEAFGKDSFDDKTTLVVFQSGFAKQFVEADILLFIEPKRVLITRRSGLLSGHVCLFSVDIHR